MTPWRETLLWQLYAQTESYLTASLESERVEQGDAEGLPSRYLITHSPEEIQEHREMELRSTQDGVAMRLWHAGPVYRMTVVAKDRTGLFASIVGALTSFGMSIVRAEAFANVRGTAVDSFTFADPLRTLELNPPEVRRLEQVVADTVLGKRKAEDLLKGRAPYRRPGKSTFKARVTVDANASDRATLFHVVAEDRPRLLYELAEKIASFDCDIDVVLIDTEGRKALDVFYVMHMGLPLTDAVAQHLRQELEKVSGG
jgi:[protein-PII] uridylyltransferase